MSVRSCLILGGGIGGLALADQLSAQGVEVTLVEREKFLGGLCRRIEIDGSGVDLGPHVLRTQRKPVFDYWIELIGSDLRPMTQTAAKMLFQNTFMSYPVKPAEILSRLPKTVLFNSAKDLLIEKLKSKLFADRSKTFEDWVVHTYGRSLYDVFFCPLTEKVWGVHPKYLDVEYGRKRIPPLSLRQTLLGIKPKTAIHPEDPAHSPPHFPKLGVFELCDKMINRASSRGARILRGASVTRLDISASGVSAEVKTADGTTEEVQTDYVVSTIPLPGLAKLLGAKES
ncbi:MAG: protoporphyrinogen/coproporphyrinogen oxidase, partial [Bdellovibrionota bacterium]